ncbi:MAG TPA: hypothetical protein VIG24_18610 [Acidimicrobiia bacterium]
MAVSLSCKVSIGGSVSEFPVTPKVEVEFERKFGMGIGKAFQEMKREHQHYLCWLAMKQSGAIVKPFDGWLDEIESTEVLVSEDPLR